MTIIDNLSQQAACKDKDTGMFFVDEGPISNRLVKAAINKAVAICNSCPVQAECLMNAVNNREEYGIWGGATTKERKKLMWRRKPITIEQAKEFIQWKKTSA